MPALFLPEAWLERPVRTVLIGAGGTGSHLVGALMALDHSLRALGHPPVVRQTIVSRPDRSLVRQWLDERDDGHYDKWTEERTTGAMMALIGYARVSTAEQDTALQTDALRKAGCERVFEDTVSGAQADRPGLAAALAYLRDGDVLAVWRLDRLGRSLPHLIETMGALDARGVGFRSLSESIDTTTSGGRLIFHVFGALGQFERDLIRERTKAGLVAAAARGRKGGRKPVVTADKLRRAREYIANGLNVREAAARLKIGKTALYAALQAGSRNPANRCDDDHDLP